VPARYGVAFALRLSTAVHVVTFGLFVWFGVLVGLGWLWWIGLVLTVVAFAYEHAVVKPSDLSRVNRAFFTANGFVGIALFVFALLDLVSRLGLRA
jgi:4-hydroxybenzoate polyprenyltransferase